MWGRVKGFFKLIGYETKRVMRNKVVFIMLIVFSVALLLALSFIQGETNSYPVAIFTDGINLEKSEVAQLIEENLKTSQVTYVDSKEQGINMVKTNSTCFFICLDAGEENDEVTAIFYYDQSNTVARTVATDLSDAKNKHSYNALTEFLSKKGIKLNKTYFEMISFESANNKSVTFKQMPFSIEVTCCVSIILMLGLAYSLARDNETQVGKNISYVPVGVNRYLLSKVVPYFVLGMLEISIMYLLGAKFFNIQFETNMLLTIALSSFFILSIIMLGLLFSLLKSQIATVILDMLVIILPIFVSIVVYVQACPMYLQILLNCIPITPFISFLNCAMYNGVILWWQIGLFALQIIIYYLLAVFILKRRVQG